MADEAAELHPETLAKYEALERVETLRPSARDASGRDRVDSSTLLPSDDRLLPPAQRGPQGRRAWHEHAVVLWAVGFLAAAALGMFVFLLVKLFGAASYR
jgi:hypothetical protein